MREFLLLCCAGFPWFQSGCAHLQTHSSWSYESPARKICVFCPFSPEERAGLCQQVLRAFTPCPFIGKRDSVFHTSCHETTFWPLPNFTTVSDRPQSFSVATHPWISPLGQILWPVCFKRSSQRHWLCLQYPRERTQNSCCHINMLKRYVSREYRSNCSHTTACGSPKLHAHCVRVPRSVWCDVAFRDTPERSLVQLGNVEGVAKPVIPPVIPAAIWCILINRLLPLSLQWRPLLHHRRSAQYWCW